MEQIHPVGIILAHPVFKAVIPAPDIAVKLKIVNSKRNLRQFQFIRQQAHALPQTDLRPDVADQIHARFFFLVLRRMNRLFLVLCHQPL